MFDLKTFFVVLPSNCLAENWGLIGSITSRCTRESGGNRAKGAEQVFTRFSKSVATGNKNAWSLKGTANLFVFKTHVILSLAITLRSYRATLGVL